MPLPHDPGPHWGEVGIHGLHRQREWDAVTIVEAPDVAGDEAWFVVLADGTIVPEEGAADPHALADALALQPPLRVHAVRRDGARWAVAARQIETADLARDPGGESVELSWDGVERSVRIDGKPTLAGVPELEQLGAARHATYVVTGTRLIGSTWEIAVAPL
jgi:hypothetical protein